MKRLTKYDKFGNAEFVGIDNAKLYERLVYDETDDYNCCIMPVDNDRFFATKEEAQAKLEELKGEK